MKYSVRHLLLVILFCQLIFSCGSDDSEDLKVCRVESMLGFFADSITYEYSSNNKLNVISSISRSNGEAIRKVSITYDSKERLSKVIDQNFFGETRNYELAYDNEDRPSTVNSWVGQPQNGYVTTFSHDDKSRLSKRAFGPTGVEYASRYTFDDRDNVAEVYFTTSGQSEKLGYRYLSYDTKDRVFAGSKDAEILNVYVFGWDPGKNNALRAEVSMLSDGTIFGQPFTADFSIGYDEEGRVIRYSSSQISTKNAFSNATYTCK